MSRYRVRAAALLALSLAACASMGKPALPGRSLASESLQRETLETIRMRESMSGGSCKDVKVVDTGVIEQSASPTYERDRLTAGKWTERWTVNQCGTVVQYKVEYSVNPMGATVINLSPPLQNSDHPDIEKKP